MLPCNWPIGQGLIDRATGYPWEVMGIDEAGIVTVRFSNSRQSVQHIALASHNVWRRFVTVEEYEAEIQEGQ